jgi:hypothetical protein
MTITIHIEDDNEESAKLKAIKYMIEKGYVSFSLFE